MNTISVESGRSFGFAFFAFFCLIFGLGVFYLGMSSTTSLAKAYTNAYFDLGLALVILGIIFAGEAFMSYRSNRQREAKATSQPA
jgi:hypothetical protein